jgi:hypothetical protein
MDASKVERIQRAIAKYPDATDSAVAKNLSNVRSAEVAEVRGKSPASHHEPKSSNPPGVSGVALSRRRVLSRRPAESAAKFIKRLPNGRAFHLRDLSTQWGMSEETIRRHARDMSCLKFVEVTEDEWHPMVMAPETASRYDN